MFKPSLWKILIILLIAVLSVSTAAIWIRLAMQSANDYTVGFSLFLAASRLIVSALILMPTAYKIRLTQINFQAVFFLL